MTESTMTDRCQEISKTEDLMCLLATLSSHIKIEIGETKMLLAEEAMKNMSLL